MGKYIFLLSLGAVALFGKWQAEGPTLIGVQGRMQWQNEARDASGERVWRDAKKYCASLELAGYYDWRLPHKAELKALHEAVANGEVALAHAEDDVYWSADVYRKLPINMWAIYWGNGHLFDQDRCDEAYVRCVRDR